MANYVFGGLGGFLGRSQDMVSKTLSSDQPTPTLNDIPILRRFVGDKTAYYDTDRFYRLVEHTAVSEDRIELYRKEGNTEELRNIISYESPRAKIQKMYKKTVQKQLSALRRQIEAIRENPALSGQQKVDQVELLQRKRTRIMNKLISQAERMGIDDY